VVQMCWGGGGATKRATEGREETGRSEEGDRVGKGEEGGSGKVGKTGRAGGERDLRSRGGKECRGSASKIGGKGWTRRAG